MISLINTLNAGNAVRLILNPPAAAEAWRIVRNETGVFADENDGVVVYEGNERSVLDDAGLVNGYVYYYKPFYWSGLAYDASYAVQAATPDASFVDKSVDPVSVFRARIDAGLATMINRGLLYHQAGAVPVLLAPPVYEETLFPAVTLKVVDDALETRALGEQAFLGIDITESALSRYVIELVAWCQNSDERNLFRHALKNVLMANFELFDAYGIVEIDINFNDMDDFESYASPMYMANGRIRCLAPTIVSGDYRTITDVLSTILEV